MTILLEDAADPVAAAARALVEAAASAGAAYTPRDLHAALAGALAPLSEAADPEEARMGPAEHLGRADRHWGEARANLEAKIRHEGLRAAEPDPERRGRHGDAADEATGWFHHHMERHGHHVAQALRKI